MENQIDEQAVNMAKAIRQSESGGDFNAKGKSGEHGGYQYTPDTWNAEAPKYGINVPIEQATPEQQNAVTYNRIKNWKDKGFDVTQIASMWNAGEGEPNAYTGTFGSDTSTHKKGDASKGVNKFGAAYDVPSYVTSVAKAYQQIKGGGQAQQDQNNPSSAQNFQFQSQKNEQQPEQQDKNTGFLGTNPNDSLYGKILDNSITRGLQKGADALTFGGVTALSNETGKALNYGYQQAKDIVTGSDLSDYSEVPDPLKAFIGAGKTLAGVGLLAASGGTAEAMAPKSVFSNPENVKIIESILPGFGKAKMTATEIYDGLKSANLGGHQGNVIKKALAEILPSYMKEQPELFTFLERNPKAAFSLGLAKKAGKFILREAVDLAGLNYLSKLLK